MAYATKIKIGRMSTASNTGIAKRFSHFRVFGPLNSAVRRMDCREPTPTHAESGMGRSATQLLRRSGNGQSSPISQCIANLHARRFRSIL
mmetsp:Transcript_58492/g.153625  ORF Transcript_58492/g.153625 Transcript_58492/m.153625 type:complete len:90 (-) Transcript_58492:434-703(-)